MLVARLSEEGADWNYPIHLGVTEAGEGEDARIKSAIGIGSLLADGIGDTIRVSLTEDSIHEIPVAQALVETAKREAEERPNSELRRSDFPSIRFPINAVPIGTAIELERRSPANVVR